MLVARLLLAALAYAVAAAVLFGDPLQPIGLATLWSNRLGVPHWKVIAFLCVAISGLVFVRPIKNTMPALYRPSAFVVLAVLLPTAVVGLYADWIRHRAVVALGADEVEEHSFFTSVRQAPADFQFFLHTAALKECTPYAWSYRRLAFFVLPPNVGANVLPERWIARCGIVRR